MEQNRYKRARLEAIPRYGRFTLIEQAFSCNLLTYYYKNDNNVCADLVNLLNICRDDLFGLLAEAVNLHVNVKFNIVAELTYEKPESDEIADVSFKIKNTELFSVDDIDECLEWAFQKLNEEEEAFEGKGSGWSLKSVDGILLRINKYSPLRGSSHIPLPVPIALRHAVVNFKNCDIYCFKWAVLCKHVEGKNRDRVDIRYNLLAGKYNFSCIRFPTPLKDVEKFEKNNEGVSINVYGIDEENIVPFKVCKKENSVHFDLLLLTEGNKSHYCFITNFERLVRSQLTKNTRKIKICKRCFKYFPVGVDSEMKMVEHEQLCSNYEASAITLPKESNGKKPILKFKNYQNSFLMPVVCYADFECILQPNSNALPAPRSSFTVARHIPMSYCFYFVVDPTTPSFIRDVIPQTPILYRGEKAAMKFMYDLQNISLEIFNAMDKKVMIDYNKEDEKHFLSVTSCPVCERQFSKTLIKVRDHCHWTGRYRTALCSECNLKRQKQKFIPVFIHNSSNYDSHFIVRELGYDDKSITVIPNTTEKYISFSKTIAKGFVLRFVDTYRFMQESLEKLVKNLPKTEFKHINLHFGVNDIPLVTRKGVFPYEYTDSWNRLLEEQLPPIEKFFSELTGCGVDDDEYEHAQRVWSHFGIKTLGEYSDLYLKTDVLLLSDVFENFRSLCLSVYGLDCAYYFTLPGFSFDAMLKITKIELELISDYDQYMFLERGIRGGIAVCVKKHGVANNKYMGDKYNPMEPSKYLMYFDANNLYGWAMSKTLPQVNFSWVPDSIKNDIVDKIMMFDDDGPVGFVLEVDVDYTEELHDQHSDLPFLAVNKVPPCSKNPKLLTTLERKENYVCHFVALKQAMRNGLKVIKVHKILQFNQSQWLKPYIELNSKKRQNSKNAFESSLFKLMNNAVFGKCMENIRKRIDLELVTNKQRAEKLISKPNFQCRIIYDESLCAIQMGKINIHFDKPIYVGLAILDISKTLMYQFHYNTIKPRYGENVKLLYMDTDSFFYEICTADVYDDMRQPQLCEHFDTSDYPITHPLHSLSNKKVIGKFKDETNGVPILEFIGLRAKMYTFKVLEEIKRGSGLVEKKAKGVKTSVVKKEISFDDYKKVLEDENEVLYKTMNMFVSKKHIVSTVAVNKLALSNFDDKRVAIDKVHTLPWGHKSIPREILCMFK